MMTFLQIDSSMVRILSDVLPFVPTSDHHSKLPNLSTVTVCAPSGISTLIGSSLHRYHAAVTSSFVKLGSIRYAAVSLK